MKNFYSTFEVAKMCEVSPGSVVRWIHEGKVKAAVTGGGHHRISAENLLEFLKLLQMPVPQELNPSILNVLIVDDENSVRRFIKETLEKAFPLCVIQEAEDGFAAGWKSHKIRPDIILLDMLLPGLGAESVCRFIRRHEELKDIRIIAMSSEDNRARQEIMLKAGADDFLGTPFTVNELQQKIGEQMQKISKPVARAQL